MKWWQKLGGVFFDSRCINCRVGQLAHRRPCSNCAAESTFPLLPFPSLPALLLPFPFHSSPFPFHPLLLTVWTRKPSCRWQTHATLAKSLHGLRNTSGVVSCIARLPIDSVPIVSYYVLYSNCVCKMRCFGDTRLLKLPWPWNPGQGSLKVIETDTIL